MKLIKLTTILNRDIAIVADEVLGIEKVNYIDCKSYDDRYDFAGQPTKIITKHGSYSVREDFDTVCALMKGAENELQEKDR